jgi:hypothetical protein
VKLLTRAWQRRSRQITAFNVLMLIVAAVFSVWWLRSAASISGEPQALAAILRFLMYLAWPVCIVILVLIWAVGVHLIARRQLRSDKRSETRRI